MPKISIIIPVYNVEKVFHRCLESVENQTFTDFECILVDDCSPDGSPQICDEYVKKDSRFVVIHKPKNEGLPKARKSGLDIAKGEFVLHLDSDDWIELNALELLIKKQKETNADIVVGQFRHIYNNSVCVNFCKFDNKFDNNLIELFMSGNTRRIWGKLYKRTLFDNYIVPSSNMAEDLFVNVQILSKLEKDKLCKINDVICNYDRTTGMIPKSRKEIYKTIESIPFYRNYKDIGDYLQIQVRNQDVISAYKSMFFMDIIYYYLRASKNIPYDKIREYYYEYYVGSNKYRKYMPLNAKISMLFLFYLGRFQWLAMLHYSVSNIAKILKRRLACK